MAPSNYHTNHGRTVSLGPKLGTGGEASVYEVVGQPDLVAKIYHKLPLPAHRAAKLNAMVGIASGSLLKFTAWPSELLAERPGGPVVGLVMRKIVGCKESHFLYSPAHRKTTFPTADWRFLINAAMNCAAAFDTAHAAGIVIGDVNQSNVLIAADAKVNLIDCDSCQVQAGGQTYLCEVGVPLFTPPELQGKPFSSVVRTADHDRFGLAILLFHLLFMGRHPFSGRYSGSGDMPIEQAIRESRFAYGSGAARAQMQRPLHTLGLADVSPAVANLYERAFAPSGGGRPSAAEWHAALKGFVATLRVCPADAGHQTPAHLPGCVWCDLMTGGAPNFFVSVSFRARTVGPQVASGFDLARVWGRIDVVPRPTRPYARPAVPAFAATPWPSHVPTVALSPPAYPAILSNPPAPPAPQLPPAVHKRANVPYNGRQSTATLVGIALGVFFVPAYFAGTVIAAKAVGRSAVGGWTVAAVFAIACFGSAGWWLTLELDRRARQRRKNALYLAERDEHRAMATSQLAAWEAKLAAQQAQARAKYDELAKKAGDTLAAIRAEADRRRSRHRAATAALAAAELAWATEVANATGEFDRTKSELSRLRDRHQALAVEQQASQQQLRARAREMQRDQYLQHVFLSDHEIPDIGPVRLATLASFGIETAFDLIESEILSIPGFGPKRVAKLMTWRASVESAFVYNPSLGIPPQDQQALDFRYFQQRQPIETRLSGGEGELARILANLEGKLKPIEEKLRQLLIETGKASADVAPIPAGC